MELPVRFTSLVLAAGLLAVAVSTSSGQAAQSTAAPKPDPRVGLRAALMNDAEAAWNLRDVAAAPKPEEFMDANDPGDGGFLDPDLAFAGLDVIQGDVQG